MDTPIISVVTICYNAVECIEETRVERGCEIGILRGDI